MIFNFHKTIKGGSKYTSEKQPRMYIRTNVIKYPWTFFWLLVMIIQRLWSRTWQTLRKLDKNVLLTWTMGILMSSCSSSISSTTFKAVWTCVVSFDLALLVCLELARWNIKVLHEYLAQFLVLLHQLLNDLLMFE